MSDSSILIDDWYENIDRICYEGKEYLNRYPDWSSDYEVILELANSLQHLYKKVNQLYEVIEIISEDINILRTQDDRKAD